MTQTATTELKNRFLCEMSCGERQRLALAMAFAARPRIILLDEATAHLDLHHRAGIMHLLREMNRDRGVTVIMAAHDLALAGRYFSRLIMLKQGEVLIDGYINKATLANLKEVRIIHGFGTGTLRQIVRDFLSSHPLVRSLRAGNKEEGGDGITVASL